MGWSLLAAVLALLGTSLLAWVLLTLGWRRALERTPAPPDPALPALVLAGPYRVVRHPQTLAALLLLAALALCARSALGWLVTVPPAVWVIARARRDERACASRFGEAYARYRRAVPFLLPSWDGPRGQRGA